ncbi:Hypothetical predicted protein [Pelobates cultripes]|uniref:Uncharacterized protein n=1 Tax=Pelobates cultripes TaxID=61616 RepID=A0AAD1R797_PELCU|nr:Hypothetical predicted protein [Pelobates cultripes]
MVDGCSIRIYDDLPFNILLERQRFMPVTRELREKGIRYRWGASGTLVVQQGDSVLTLLAQEDPKEFLKALHLPRPADRNPVTDGANPTRKRTTDKGASHKKTRLLNPP